MNHFTTECAFLEWSHTGIKKQGILWLWIKDIKALVSSLQGEGLFNWRCLRCRGFFRVHEFCKSELQISLVSGGFLASEKFCNWAMGVRQHRMNKT